jgi:phospholipase/lecithinase/hemolysin
MNRFKFYAQNALLSAFLILPGIAYGASYSNLWIFGDSFSDNGATVDILPLLKAVGSPPLPKNGKLADDKLWIEFFAESLGMPERAETIWNKYNRNPGNYSMIAASSLRQSLIIQDFPDQIDSFQEKFKSFDPNDLIVVQMGINDALDAMKTFGAKAPQGREAAMIAADAYLDQAMQSYEAEFKRLISLGGKKFLVVNSPDLGLAPFARQRKATEIAHVFSLKLNAKLKAIVARLSKSNRSVSIKSMDLLAKLIDFRTHPASYGIADNLIYDLPCGQRGLNNKVCTEPSKYFYYDLNHPTSQINEVIANEAVKIVSQ